MKNIIIILFLVSGMQVCGQRVEVVATQGFTELSDPTADTLSDWSGVLKGLHSSFVTIDKRFAKSLKPEIVTEKKQRLRGWKGEKLSAQLLLWTTEEISKVQVNFTDFSNPTAKLSKDIAQARFVRYVMTDEFAPGCERHANPDDFPHSLSADILDNVTAFDLEAKKVRPVWISIKIPEDVTAGMYTGKIYVSGRGIETSSLDLELEIIDQTLPQSSKWIFHLDQWQNPSAVARTAGVPLWSDAHFEALKPIMQLLASAGQKVITTTLNKDPWNAQTYDAFEDMIIWTKNEEGGWSYDYTIFDRWVSFMMSLGIKEMINCYSIIPWNYEVHYRDGRAGKMVNVVAKPGTPAFEELWKPFLVDFKAHLAKKGWLPITNIAMDERERTDMDEALQLLTTVSPELGISYADNQKSYQRYPNSRDISISVGHPFSEEDLADRRSRGLNTTFYVCCADIFPNQFTFSEPAESAYLGWYALATNFNGLLRWAYNSWVQNPLQDSRYRLYPAGDTYIVYPGGRSSIRFERMLEGIQDYEKALITIKALEKANDRASLEKLQWAIAKLKNPVRRAEWNEELNEAKKLLNDISASL
ncbi:MAG: DUF6067 family protein [Niabella sp.]